MKRKYILLIIILFTCLFLFSTPSLALIPGDFGSANNGPPDGVVDFEDLMIFALAYGSTSADANWNEVCDIYLDGIIDFEDLMIFAMHYGQRAVTGVTLDQATMTLTVGGATGTLVATVAPVTATNKNVTWSSSAPAVATVVSGVITPLTAGTTTITVTTVDGGKTATCAVTVTPTPVAVTGVTLNHATMTLTAGGATGTLVATVAPVTATNKNVTWSSSAPAVATVANGVVTPVTAGTTTITVTTVDGGKTATCAVTVNPPTPVAIGDSYGGGIVAYILQPGEFNGVYDYDAAVQHGLIAATANAPSMMSWSNITETSVGVEENTAGTALGTGQTNTTAIVGQAGCTSGAAYYCDNLTEGGYTDWFLPSRSELYKLYINRVAIGGFTDYFYWSSSESFCRYAWYHNFIIGIQNNEFKGTTLRVRAVRAF